MEIPKFSSIMEDPKKPPGQVFAEVLDFFQDPSRFTQGYYYTDKNDHWCSIKDAHCYCVIGAICAFTNGHGYDAQCLLQRVSEHMYNAVIQNVNDRPGGYDEIIRALTFAKSLWLGFEHTQDDLTRSIPSLLVLRNQ